MIRDVINDTGNVKVMYFNGKMIFRKYPYLIKPRKEKSENDLIKEKIKRDILKETDEKKKRINAVNRFYRFVGYGLNNNWDYFITVTFNKRKIDRYDVDLILKKVCKLFNHWKDRYCFEFKYCFIIEKHKNGAYHLHGLISGLKNEMIEFSNYRYEYEKGKYIYPSKKSNFIQYGIKQKYFDLGMFIISPIQDRNNVINYISKYISKDIYVRKKNGKSIFNSNGLNGFDSNLYYFNESDNKVYDKNNNVIFELDLIDQKDHNKINDIDIWEYYDNKLLFYD